MMLDIAGQYSIDRPGAPAHPTTPADLYWLRVPNAQLALITGDDARAKRLATAALWASDVVVRDRTDVLMIKAAASWRLGEHDEAVEAFRQSVALCSQIDSAHAYLIIPENNLRDIAAASGAGIPDHVLQHLAQHGTVFPTQAASVAFSPRELEVLMAMRDRATVADIGRALHLSVNTVKKHLAAINAKLGVHDRRAALVQAARLGFIDTPEDDTGSRDARRGARQRDVE